MSEMKTYFVFDSETGFILSGFDCCVDKQDDGYNLYTRPYKYPEYHSKEEKCRLDTLYNDAVMEGVVETDGESGDSIIQTLKWGN